MKKILFVFVGLLTISTLLKAEATLTEVNVQFHTTRDDKDHDTLLTMWITVAGDKTIAHSESFANNVRFPDPSDSPIFALGEIDKKITRSEVASGVWARLRMVTNGDDNWWFRFTLTFRFSDDSVITMHHNKEEKFDDDERTEAVFFLKPN